MSATGAEEVAHGQRVRRSRVLLPPERSAPARARRAVAAALRGAGHEDLVDAAELAVTELVTNAALHARTDVEVVVEAGPREVRVEVRDGSPVLPQRRRYGEHATTGRGMALVTALTSDCGAAPEPGGKVVWFVLRSAAEEPSVEDLLAAFDDGSWDAPDVDPAAAAAPPGGAREVHLLGVPPLLWGAAHQHHDALLRELGLYAAARPGVRLDLDAVELARRAVFQPVVDAVERARRAGAVRSVLPAGHPSPLPPAPEPFDVHLEVTPEVGAATAALQDALDTAERLAHDGELLAFPGQPEVVAVRDWMCEQVQSQLLGVAPRPWPGASDARFEVATQRAPADVEGVLADVAGSDRGVVAADEGNRVVAVSAPLAAALGWRVEDLLGRRVVVLIPPALREAHVAGFSRHLSTGQAHVLGVPLVLPVLRADGGEVECRFLVEQRAAAAGRSLYLAWIEPVEHPAAAHPAAATG